MSTWTSALAGAAGFALVGITFGAVMDREIRDGVTRVLTAALLVPVLVVAGFGLRLPKLTRRRVTAESLAASLTDDWYERRTWAINWPNGALVLLRTKRKRVGPAPQISDEWNTP